MKYTKKYTAIQLGIETVNDNVSIKLAFGEITGPYYSRDYPKQEFDTEEDALEYAYKTDKYTRWIIIPLIIFDNY
jgi:hypothetical protein